MSNCDGLTIEPTVVPVLAPQRRHVDRSQEKPGRAQTFGSVKHENFGMSRRLDTRHLSAASRSPTQNRAAPVIECFSQRYLPPPLHSMRTNTRHPCPTGNSWYYPFPAPKASVNPVLIRSDELMVIAYCCIVSPLARRLTCSPR